MAGRKIKDEAEAKDCLSRVAASGQSRVVWARAHGIDARSLNAWRLNLGRGGRRQAAANDADGLRLVELVSMTPCRVDRPVSIRVTCGPFTVEVPSGFEEEHLARLLAVVATC